MGGGALAKFDGTTWTIYDAWNSGMPDNNVSSVAVEQNGTKWIGTSFGNVAEFDGTNWIIHTGFGRVYSITIDENGIKWIGASVGLAKYDGTNLTIYNTSNSGLPNNNVSSVAIDENGVKWIGTAGRRNSKI